MNSRAARLKPPSFVPTVSEITAGDVGRVAGLEAVVAHWAGKTDENGGPRSAEDWIRAVREDWGSAGLYLSRGGEVLGFLVHGPKSWLPAVEEYPVGPVDDDGAILAYVEGDARACKRLLVRMLRDLRGRGVSKVEAIASDVGSSRHVRTRLLLESGWRPVRRGWRHGKPYTLVSLDLGSAVEAGDLARTLLGRVRLPTLGGMPVPGVHGGALADTTQVHSADVKTEAEPS